MGGCFGGPFRKVLSHAPRHSHQQKGCTPFAKQGPKPPAWLGPVHCFPLSLEDPGAVLWRLSWLRGPRTSPGRQGVCGPRVPHVPVVGACLALETTLKSRAPWGPPTHVGHPEGTVEDGVLRMLSLEGPPVGGSLAPGREDTCGLSKDRSAQSRPAGSAPGARPTETVGCVVLVVLTSWFGTCYDS